MVPSNRYVICFRCLCILGGGLELLDLFTKLWTLMAPLVVRGHPRCQHIPSSVAALDHESSCMFTDVYGSRAALGWMHMTRDFGAIRPCPCKFGSAIALAKAMLC